MIKSFVKFFILILSLSVVASQNPACLMCNSADNAACINPDGVAFSNPCDAESGFRCYSRILENGHVRRGCISELDPAIREACNTPTCRICQGTNQSRNESNCNVGLFPEGRLACVICNDNSTCAGDTLLSPQHCTRFVQNDRCYIRRPDNTTYVRGCLGSETCSEPNCWSCQGDGCNHRDFTGGSLKIATNFLLVITGIIAIILANN